METFSFRFLQYGSNPYEPVSITVWTTGVTAVPGGWMRAITLSGILLANGAKRFGHSPRSRGIGARGAGAEKTAVQRRIPGAGDGCCSAVE
ncbi:hypothetical protein ACH46N_22290 [Streptomyces pristinaespiralis]|uniref:hypothetical protein n=1 Tax=Streptomyces pristinaespiralis TaxID=38300 RepID=UPI0001801299|nr:hypothetical protein [Streptomyces pristinaespiralis]QMU12271.1 hypothetical protein H3L99_00590 [Streptomyces pristinaespiralis]